MGGAPAERSRDQRVISEVGQKAERRLRARAERRPGLWFGIGMFGLVGWAVAVPTVAGVLLGVWLDGAVPAGFSWTLSGLAGGVILGCLNAWWWVNREGRGGRDAEPPEPREPLPPPSAAGSGPEAP